jgi:hypothetical protein
MQHNRTQRAPNLSGQLVPQSNRRRVSMARLRRELQSPRMDRAPNRRRNSRRGQCPRAITERGRGLGTGLNRTRPRRLDNGRVVRYPNPRLDERMRPYRRTHLTFRRSATGGAHHPVSGFAAATHDLAGVRQRLRRSPGLRSFSPQNPSLHPTPHGSSWASQIPDIVSTRSSSERSVGGEQISPQWLAV